ncbi:MAG TPA: SusC/RagA family TonB-linked outer membrane protein, partial [Gemmatimonadaceae bacterium]|nr:SusC/RagA family TonB-linked outer membrane protein [Gemmatimonadaceae bacterium]
MSRFTRRAVTLGASLLALTLSAQSAHAQSAVISGRVTSESGNALEVSNVFITELHISVPANADGRYSITIPAERVRGQAIVLRARAIGYASISKPLTLTAGAHTLDFALKRDINRLQEVVVTGTVGATEIKKTAFNITSLDQADMPVPATNPLLQLQGKVTGVQIVQPSGRPGTAAQAIMRGPKMLNAEGRSQQPLTIVDGIIVTSGLQDINPQDIESVEVVKGAAASSMYGSRAGSGVIQITTKSGRNAAPGVKFGGRMEYGLSDVQGRYPFSTRHFLMLDETGKRFCIKTTPVCSRTVDFEEEALRVNQQGGDFALAPYSFERDYGIGQAPTKPELKGLYMVNQWPRRYDPIEQTITPGQTINSNLDATGKFGNTSYFISGSQLKEEGAIKYLQGYNRYSGRVNVDQKFGDAWTVAFSSFYSRSSQYADGEWFRLTRVPTGVNLLRHDDKGRLFVRSNPLQQGAQNENPLYDNQARYRLTNADRYLGSAKANFTPFSWLDFDATGSIDRRRSNFFQLNDRGFRSTASAPINLGSARADANADASYNIGLGGTARHDFSPDLNGLVNVRYTFEQEDGLLARGEGDALALPGLRSLDAVTTNFNLDSDESSVRAIGASGGVKMEYKGRYILDALYRYDGSSLFGADERWHGYYRGSLAWRLSDESFWKFPTAVNDLKLRGSVGTAGGRPRFSAQYETFNIATGGLVSATNKGNRNLKPETTLEVELGFDAEVRNRFGISATYARDITSDQIVLVPPSVSSGFQNQWKNAGTLDGKTYEFSINAPIITRSDLLWSMRAGWDRSRTYITELGVPPFFQTNSSSTFRYAVGERLGQIYGKRFVRSCSEFPAAFQAQCGPGKEWQANDEGYIVWVGTGNSYKDGVTKNLWQAVRPGCLSSTGVAINVVGEVDCRKQGGTVNNPWGQAETHWGMLTNVRDSTGSAILLPLGNTLPDWRLSFSQTLQWKKLYVYGLVDHSHGNFLMNEEIHWSLGDFMVDEEDQIGKTVENGKPIGYYWRATRPENGSGVGGFYDVLGANNHTV